MQQGNLITVSHFMDTVFFYRLLLQFHLFEIVQAIQEKPLDTTLFRQVRNLKVLKNI